MLSCAELCLVQPCGSATLQLSSTTEQIPLATTSPTVGALLVWTLSGCWCEDGCCWAEIHVQSGQKVNRQFIYSAIHLVWCNLRNLGSGQLRHFV